MNTGAPLRAAIFWAGIREAKPPALHPNPRTGHPYLYPALFSFRAFRRFLANNGFTVNRVVPYGFVPPLWSLIKPFVFTEKRKKLEDHPLPRAYNGRGPHRVPFSTRLNYASSSPFWTAIKPRHYAWLCVYDLTNSDREGSRKLFDRGASRQSHEERAVLAAGR